MGNWLLSLPSWEARPPRVWKSLRPDGAGSRGDSCSEQRTGKQIRLVQQTGFNVLLTIFIWLSVQGGGFTYALNGFHPGTRPPCRISFTLEIQWQTGS